ncbi:hypothetical protein OG943_08925 [Amycolatopsis sp. NBC_00345]|uniref:hypothetical protein n=1 Tax=Amycolatopsis sp. NBC_00345 TaxID=2975955 RepID=UPI002E2604F5
MSFVELLGVREAGYDGDVAVLGGKLDGAPPVDQHRAVREVAEPEPGASGQPVPRVADGDDPGLPDPDRPDLVTRRVGQEETGLTGPSKS